MKRENYDLGRQIGYEKAMKFTYCEEAFAILEDEAKQLLTENVTPYTKGYAQGTIDAIRERCCKNE